MRQAKNKVDESWRKGDSNPYKSVTERVKKASRDRLKNPLNVFLNKRKDL